MGFVCICIAPSLLGSQKAPKTEPHPPQSPVWHGTLSPSSPKPILEGIVQGAQVKANGRREAKADTFLENQMQPLCYLKKKKEPLCVDKLQKGTLLGRLTQSHASAHSFGE